MLDFLFLIDIPNPITTTSGETNYIQLSHGVLSEGQAPKLSPPAANGTPTSTLFCHQNSLLTDRSRLIRGRLVPQGTGLFEVILANNTT